MAQPFVHAFRLYFECLLTFVISEISSVSNQESRHAFFHHHAQYLCNLRNIFSID